MTSILSKIFVAKSEKDKDFWLPLWMHHMDTAGIMEYLLDEFVSDSFSESCCLESKSVRQTAVFLAMVHDIGKATVGFQYKITQNLILLRERIEHYGICFPDSYESDKLHQFSHGTAGEVILRYFECPYEIAEIVGAHHGMPAEDGTIMDSDLSDNPNDIQDFTMYFGSQNTAKSTVQLKAVWRDMIESALNRAELKSIDELPQALSVEARMLLSGLLIMADWLASNVTFFPLMFADDVQPTEFPYPRRTDAAWKQVEFPSQWTPKSKSFEELYMPFGFHPSPFQREMLSVVSATEHGGIFILEAPMGCGKTEAALTSAELLAAKQQKNGLFFGLPTQATANGIFPRILKWSESQSEEVYHSVQLKHGNAEMNDVFTNIQRGIPQEESESGLIVHNWFCDSKKACLADFVTATVDQMLMLALKRKHVMLLHLGLSEKVVIIDEVHAYDAYMNQYLERALRWLGAYHTPVILLSATLPAARRMALIRSYLGIRRSDPKFENNLHYPLLTWTDGADIHQKPLHHDSTSKAVHIQLCKQTDILPQIQNVVQGDGCVGIIVNSVKRAQELAVLLRSNTSAEILLYHAQYLFPDRAAKEKEILSRIGKQSHADTRKRLIVIGTQVLEQSLDIDFDLLITDICPMDLLLQRIGRLHRHIRSDRPKVAFEPGCFVMTDELDAERTGTKNIYGEWLLQTTLADLPQEIRLPDDISPLVQTVYSAVDEDNRSYQEYVQTQQKMESAADIFRIREPSKRSIHGLLSRSILTKTERAAEASVRGGISSLEVLLMQKRADGSIHFLPHQHEGAVIAAIPDESEARIIAEQKLRLPSIFCSPYLIDSTINALEMQCKETVSSWQQSHWLNSQLVLFLNDDLDGELLGYRLHYNYATGLQYQKKEECE